MLKGIADYRPEAIRHLIYYLFTTFHPNEKRYNNLNTAIYRSAGNDTCPQNFNRSFYHFIARKCLTHNKHVYSTAEKRSLNSITS